MRYILTFIFFIISSSAFNQITHKKINLLWQEPSFFFDNNLRIDYLKFDGANYLDSLNNLPVYRELIKIDSPNVEFFIENAEFALLSDKEKNILASSVKVTERVRIVKNIKTKNKKLYAEITIIPFRYKNSKSIVEKLISFSIAKNYNSSLKKSLNKNISKTIISKSALNVGKWVKIAVDTSGIFKITYNQLLDMGITDPASVSIYGFGSGNLPIANNINNLDDLPPNAIYFNKGNDNIFNKGDYLLFYAQGPLKWTYKNKSYIHSNNIYSKESYYFISSDNKTSIPPVIMPLQGDALTDITSFEDYEVLDVDKYNLIHSGSLWVGDIFDIDTKRNYKFESENIIKTSPVNISVSVLARSAGESSFDISVNNNSVGNIPVKQVYLSSSTSEYANIQNSDMLFYTSSDKMNIGLEFNKYSPSALGWMNYIRLNFMRELIFTSNQMLFRNNKNTSTKSRFVISGVDSNTLVWDITNVHDVKQINFEQSLSKAMFILDNTFPREFLAFDSSADYPSPRVIGEIENQNLHSLSNIDMIIISPKEFLSQANSIADLHRSEDGLSVFVAQADKIYNEFSSGAVSAIAIRNFVRMLYRKANKESEMPKYLLLFGDGSFDNINFTNVNTNILPTFQSQSSLSPVKSFVCDDFFALLDDDEGGTLGLLDLGVGRFPVSTKEQADILVSKVKTYHKKENVAAWTMDICLIADDEDNNIHMRDADYLSRYIETNYSLYNVKRLFLDDFTQDVSSGGERYPDLNKALEKQVNKGALIINYTGHGNENGLAHEKILTLDDINSWKNINKLPLFMTATCEFSRFDNYNKMSAGEFMLVRQLSGAIGLFTTTRLVFASPNFILNKNFYKYVFSKNNQGDYLRLGDIMKETKNASPESVNKRSFTLLGDPALMLNYPEKTINIKSIVNTSSNHKTDTIKAFQKINVVGEISNASNKKILDFDGIVDVVVYDKFKDKYTLGNDFTSFKYRVQNNIIYKGKAKVAKGDFNFTFVVPKDIMYNYDKGKISCYANNNDFSAAGSFKDFIVGSSDKNNSSDNIGPEIKLYLDNEDFMDGQSVNVDPLLLVLLSDASGINTIGNTVGHDIIAILDNDIKNKIKLNDYYQASLDDFENGSVKYKFSKLKIGKHTLSFKVWDNLNNSNDASIDFIVAKDAKLAISHLLNYPNPFTTNTSFYFEHNSQSSNIDVLIQILTISGSLVKTIETSVFTKDIRIGPIDWDGTDDFGNPIARGVYFYKLKIKTEKGKYAERYQKIVILK